MMKKIALIYMGGTFGCVGEPLSPMPAEQFIPLLQHTLPVHLDVTFFVSPVIKDSSACTASDWLGLIQFIQQKQQADYQHFVIIHGTDTLSYASAVLAQLMGQSAHIVLTGSQYPLLNTQGNNTREFTDAIDNLNFALESVTQINSGVYLAFHHQLIHAQTALKFHTTELNAFRGISCEQHLKVNSTIIQVNTTHIKKAHNFSCVSLMLQPLQTEQHIQYLKAFLDHPPHALILQGFGTGNIAVNDEFIAILQKIRQQNCAVIITSQVPFGALDQRYAVSEWVQHANFLVSHSYSHADLYAKTLKMYLKYDSVDQWHQHWNDEI
jgi:L-asparaginase